MQASLYYARKRRLGRIAAGSVVASLIALGTRLCIVGDSMSYAEGDNFGSGYITWLQLFANGRFHYPSTSSPASDSADGGNMARSAQPPSGYAARKATIAAGVGTGVLVIGGIENGASGAWASIEEVIEACPTARAVFITPAAPTQQMINSPALKTAFDDAAVAYAAANSTPERPVVFLSQTWDGITLSPDGVATGPHSYDGTHQNVLGSYLQAENMWTQMEPYFAAGNAYDALADAITNGDNIMGSASDMAGDESGVATPFKITPGDSGVTITPSKGTLFGFVSQVIEISGTAGTTSKAKYEADSAYSHSMTIGESIGGVCAIKVSNAAQDGPATGLKGLGPTTYFTKSRWGSQAYAGGQGTFSDAADFEGIVRFRPPDIGQINADQSSLDFEFEWSHLVGAVDARIEIARPMLFNFTDLGIE